MHCIDIIIETPKGSTQKYNYDPDSHFFKLKKILPSGMVFPYDFGFVPGTKGEDGDPLDVILISEFYSFPGCMIECRIIGGLKALQSKEAGKKEKIRNDRYLAIPMQSVIFENIKSIDDLPKRIIKELEEFFINYNKVQEKEFEVMEKMSPEKSWKLIKSGREE
jgi:inorganic pyrophosphatase